MDSKTYDRLKQVAQIWLPALGSAYFSLAGIWHFPNPDEVVGTIVIIDTFLGAVLHLSSKVYSGEGKYDGEFNLVTTEDGSQLHMKNTDIEALFTKDQVVFKVNKPPKVDLAG